jgi:hypothetical protein
MAMVVFDDIVDGELSNSFSLIESYRKVVVCVVSRLYIIMKYTPQGEGKSAPLRHRSK